MSPKRSGGSGGGGGTIQNAHPTLLHSIVERTKSPSLADGSAISPSEHRLSRLRYIYGALMQENAAQHDHQQQHFQQLRRAATACSSASAAACRRRGAQPYAAAGAGSTGARAAAAAAATAAAAASRLQPSNAFALISRSVITATDPLARMRAARHLGNQYSRMNLTSPASSPAPPLPRAVFDRATHYANIHKSRAFGNEASRRNSQAQATQAQAALPVESGTSVRRRLQPQRSRRLLQAQAQPQQRAPIVAIVPQKIANSCYAGNQSSASVASTISSSAQHDYGLYCRLRNRLVLLEQCRMQMMQLYGKDEFLDEYTELLEHCWRYEAKHRSVEQFATDKIVEVLADLEQMQRKRAKTAPAAMVVNARAARTTTADESVVKQLRVPKKLQGIIAT